MGDITIKIILVGDSGVGKSSLLKSFIGEPFQHVYTSTVGIDFEIKSMKLNGENVIAQIWDTAGQERFRTITTSYYRSSHVILLAFDVTDMSTFQSLDEWMCDINQYANDNVGILVCGNKQDCEKRDVDYELAKTWADANKLPYIETSALDTSKVDIVFTRLAEIAVEKVKQKRAEAASAPAPLSLQDKKKKDKCC